MKYIGLKQQEVLQKKKIKLQIYVAINCSYIRYIDILDSDRQDKISER